MDESIVRRSGGVCRVSVPGRTSDRNDVWGRCELAVLLNAHSPEFGLSIFLYPSFCVSVLGSKIELALASSTSVPAIFPLPRRDAM